MTNRGETAISDTKLLSKVAWRLLPFMLLLYIVSYLDRINVSFAGLQMNKDLGFSETVFGFGAGIFFVGYSLFGVPSNILLEKFGARKLISTIMIIWGTITVCMCLVKSDISFYVLRFLLGVAEAGFFPGMILYLTYWFPKKEHGLAVARFMSAIPLAGVLGGVLASVVLNTHVFGLPGWQLLFIASGLPAVLLGIAVLFFLTDDPLEAKWLSETERMRLSELLRANSGALVETMSEGAFSESKDKSENISQPPKTGSIPTSPAIFSTIKMPAVWFFATIYFSLTLGMYGFQLWLPQIIKAFGSTSDSSTALLTAIPALFQAIGMNVVGRHSDQTNERKYHLAASASTAAIALILAGYLKNPYLGLAALSVTAFGIWGTVGPFWAMPTSIFTSAQKGVGIGLINSVGNLGGFVGPYLVGAIRSNATNESTGVMYALFALAVSLFCGSALALTFKQKIQKI
ncbi:MAG TPA: MFS transporter [Oculatellaceae cyanobacterium]